MARPALKRVVVDYIVRHYDLPIRRACRLIKQHRSNQYYSSVKDPKLALRARMREIAHTRLRYGYPSDGTYGSPRILRDTHMITICDMHKCHYLIALDYYAFYL